MKNYTEGQLVTAIYQGIVAGYCMKETGDLMNIEDAIVEYHINCIKASIDAATTDTVDRSGHSIRGNKITNSDKIDSTGIIAAPGISVKPPRHLVKRRRKAIRLSNILFSIALTVFVAWTLLNYKLFNK